VKTIPLVLSLSLAANLALGAAWLWRGSSAAMTPLAAPAAVDQLVAAQAPPPLAPVPLTPEIWQKLSQGTDAEYIARLRAEGFPMRTLYVLAYSRVAQSHAAEYKKFAPSAEYEYWRRSLYQYDALSPEDRAARRALNRQVSDEVRQLIGADTEAAMTSFGLGSRERQYGSLPAAKVDQLSSIVRDYSELSTMVRDRTQGIILPEDRDQLAALEKEKRADLEKLLTPAELLEYDLRSSPSAGTTRSRLRYFEPTEDEYRAITALQLAFDNTYGGTNPSGAQQVQRREAAAELTAQIKALLPADRYAEYEIKTDPAYANLARTVAQYAPSADPVAAFNVQKDLVQRATSIRQDRNLDTATRNAQLDALAAEANTRMEAAVGAEAVKGMKVMGGPLNSLLNRKSGKP
jgi:hypothetical protein